MTAIPSSALDQIFLQARTHAAWQRKDVPEALLRRLYDLARLGPTEANGCPMRVVFVCSAQAKERLRPCLSPGNVEKTMTAPVTAIVGADLRFYDHLPSLFPHVDARSWYAGNASAEVAARLSASLQGAYLMIAARALGLDCGPMAGFDRTKVDESFFAGSAVRSLFLCNLGFGDSTKLRPRLPRLSFEEACAIA